MLNLSPLFLPRSKTAPACIARWILIGHFATTLIKPA